MIVYVGDDAREPEAFEVCRASLLRHTSIPLHIVRLGSQPAWAGFHNRQFLRSTATGQRIDAVDGKPFSTDFAFTRFLVPAMSLYQGWALFCDGDFLFTSDIAELFGFCDDRYAVRCVKHQHVPKEFVKMDGMQQTRYHRKNWSSLVLWNCAHSANKTITSECVNKMPGSWLHGFGWLRDEQIGGLPLRWNWLSGVDADLGITPSGIHFTLGIPTMDGHENAPYADLWRAEYASLPERRRLAAVA